MTSVRVSRRARSLLALSLLALAVVACNGAAVGPSLEAISDQSTTLGEPVVVAVTVDHPAPASVAVTAVSSNEQVVPASGLSFTGSGASRVLTVTPSSVHAGTTTITVTATDGDGLTAAREFAMEVAVPFQGDPQVLTTQDAGPIGLDVAIDGERLVAGGLEATYVFELAGDAWVERQRLASALNGLTDIQDFGSAVALSGDRVLVGADESTLTVTEQGAAFLFELMGDAFAYGGELIDEQTPEEYDHLGRSVAISGDHLLVGAPGASESGIASGSVVVFAPDVTDGWTLLGKLTPSDAADGTVFGEAIDVAGDLLAVGDYANDELGLDAGAAYVFAREGGFWYEEAKLLPPDVEAGDQYGIDVAVDDGWVLVASPDDDDAALNAGAVYVFTDTGAGWEVVDKLFPEDPAVNGGFGSGVALDYPYAVVAAKYDDELGQNTGAVYVFRHDGADWHQLVKLASPAPTVEAYFGWSVDISGDHLVASQLGAEVLTVVFER